eukprot:CAMPEP_0119010954 /NCGR_PEP_ID=MMETSP1176-20130426/5360_1 /TAXON_ID=265551 /ORGANISM="Synedropsis recta cf, Strain CCMP1620" /LENGTH=199 /DNA_ID=CAMNT_0006963703 /DNA_START=262 /DNA_END=862 /DNA_ORIENTATION=-
MSSSSSSNNKNPSIVEIRPVTDKESLWEFLRIAAHEDDVEVVKSNPDLVKYVQDFDNSNDTASSTSKSAGDVGVVAFLNEDDDDSKSSNDEPVGSAWGAILDDDPTKRGYGHVRDDIPELAIGVSSQHQGKEIGTALLQQIFVDMQKKLIPGISLSCRDDNAAALQLYQRLGFERVKGTEVSNRIGGCSFTMLRLFDED